MVGSVHISVIVGSVYVSAMYVCCIWQCVCGCSIGATLASLPDSGYWTLTTIDVLYNSTTTSSLDASVIYAPLDFCYHCSLPNALTDANGTVSLAIVELQVSSCTCYLSYVCCVVIACMFNTILCELSVFIVAFDLL
jgi:hypothetical protein